MQNVNSLKIGQNPILKIGETIGFPYADVWAIDERQNPGGSHKDRPVARMIREEIKKGTIGERTTIMDYTTGSAGISIAAICKEIGLRAIVIMPEGITEEREKLIKNYSAELVLTSRVDFVRGAVAKALEIKETEPDSFLLNQSGNPDNKNSFHDLGYEILAHFKDGKPIDYIVIGAGTGATVVGVSEVIKRHSPQTQVVTIDESGYPSTLNFKIGHGQTEWDWVSHKLYGYSAGKISPILCKGIDRIDEIRQVSDEEAFAMSRELIQKGMPVGPSSAANIIVIRRILQSHPHARIVTVFFDHADRYRSVGLY